jgi:hydroxyacylglutathione hydrolase
MVSGHAWSQTVASSMDVHWDEGATDCKASPQAPIQVHAYNRQTLIREANAIPSLL